MGTRCSVISELRWFILSIWKWRMRISKESECVHNIQLEWTIGIQLIWETYNFFCDWYRRLNCICDTNSGFMQFYLELSLSKSSFYNFDDFVATAKMVLIRFRLVFFINVHKPSLLTYRQSLRLFNDCYDSLMLTIFTMNMSYETHYYCIITRRFKKCTFRTKASHRSTPINDEVQSLIGATFGLVFC